MVEMAGIEPASEKLEHRTSTSVEDFYFTAGWKPSNIPCSYPLKPESLLSHEPRKFHAALQLCIACSTAGWRTELADVAIIGHVLCLTAYAAKGRAAKLVRLALKLCTDLTRSVPLGSPFGISLLRRSLSSPDEAIIAYSYQIYIR